MYRNNLRNIQKKLLNLIKIWILVHKTQKYMPIDSNSLLEELQKLNDIILYFHYKFYC